jgi:SAM-dependent methyltransferase
MKNQLSQITWAEAVRRYRAVAGNEKSVRDNYFDLPVREAAERFARSEEFAEVSRLLGQGKGRSILDLGAGNGIASYALAQAGWQVMALEPDASAEVGAGAIRLLAAEAGLPITVAEEFGERLPFADDAFDAIHARQVLHHVQNLEMMVAEMNRVMRSGGLLLNTREHIADDEAQLTAFRKQHPLHHLYGGENAYPLKRYLAAFAQAGFHLREMWGPLQSTLNFFPGTEVERQKTLRQVAGHSYFRVGRLLSWSAPFRAHAIRRATRRDQTPGRIFSFLLEKP